MKFGFASVDLFGLDNALGAVNSGIFVLVGELLVLEAEVERVDLCRLVI